MKGPRGVYPGEIRGAFFRATGEFRPPRKGEFYLSGAIIEAYRAPNDLAGAYWIAKQVQPEPVPAFVCSACGAIWQAGHRCRGLRATSEVSVL